MDSSPVLSQRSQNKILSDFERLKNEQNKKQVDPKSNKSLASSHLLNKDIENKDPAELGKKASLQAGISKLPVLAKSLRLQTPSHFKQSHLRWEEKPLAGKAKKIKPCTRPVPFNFSKPKNTTVERKNQLSVAASTSQTHANKSDSRMLNVKHTKHRAALSSNWDSTEAMRKYHGKAAKKESDLSGQSGLSNTLKKSVAFSNPVSSSSSTSGKADSSSVQPALSAELRLESMKLLSLKETPTKSQTVQNAEPIEVQKPPNDKKDSYQPDPSALLSILRNEGVDVSSRAPGTLQSKPYNYQPQRVSVMKGRQKPAPSTVCASAGLVRRGHFSPDAAALQSILLTGGVKAGGPMDATPRNSVCPPGRGTSIYTAQRVPVRKIPAEVTGGPVALLKKTPQTKLTPQRVPNPSYHPMSAMKWQTSAQRSLHITPGFKSCKSTLQKEEVVQRLFCDAEEVQTGNVVDEDFDAKNGERQLPVEASSKKVLFEEKSTSRASSKEEEKHEMSLPLPRESVIFMSTGKKLFRVSRVDNTEISDQRGPGLETQNDPKEHSEMSVGFEPIHQIIPSAQRVHKDLIAHKHCALSPAVALLRKRFPPLEELRMDEEVAFFTSLSFPSSNRCPPPQPRCENPLALILHFKESTKFVPIHLDLFSDLSPRCSPLNE